MRIRLFALCLLLGGCQSQLPPLPEWQGPEGRIVDLRSGATLTPGQLLERLAVASRVIVGEKHDNPDHHALELWLARALGERRAQGSLLLEMLGPDQQPRVDAIRAQRKAGKPVANLEQALDWRKGWDWSQYGPLVTWALAQPAPLLAANLERSEIMRIYKERPLPAGTASRRDSVRLPLLAQIRESHCGMLPDDQLPAMLAVQQQRDRRMAERLRDAPLPALLVAGGFHARRDLGVPVHLRDLGVQEVRVLLLVEAGQAVTTREADYAWYTPALPEKDYCADMQAR
ncbi:MULTISPECIES: ChaN family lipoprotein [Pseudomonas aeruginosa group]|uniref:ChaN family lipoprotein n=1 Tax=Pseudomonas aeruginosa group TaxID=136841 RepID=UPI0006B26A35|nr:MULTISPECIES: ChaN family lipoprotein [Pseudomonas aeruginosa group]KPD26963.1 iron(III) ABC transporter [Pseudomonas paraeruginosa]KQB30062.1 iron(III) ABC transporter [Pseudomonas paraeruginosa]MDT1027175.1 ChaN family lipoprotein [Pseudomonas paraeruginosa]PHJ28842.1 iron(III) ABC transporter [Pseudomonas paraeruginosa]QQV47884.1 ChaN family lipoprotein [Pseudomonas aeruginosa]